jgi:dienelactone hydrolase
MPEIMLYHHVMGLTPGVREFADRLRSGGHVVHTPDLFDAHSFTTLEEGMTHARSIGFDTIIDHGVAEAEALGPELVYAGFSMGVMPAQKLAQTREGARGALLFDSCLPVTEFGDGWPRGVPVQIHGMDADPIFAGEGDLDAGRELVDSTDQAELFLYPGDVHIFADSSLATYDETATEVMTDRVLAFLSKLE